MLALPASIRFRRETRLDPLHAPRAAGVDESRGYLQSWLGEGAIPERSAQRIYPVGNKILAAGQAGEPEVAA